MMKQILIIVLLVGVIRCSSDRDSETLPIDPVLTSTFNIDFEEDYNTTDYPNFYDGRVFDDDNTPNDNVETNDGVILGRVLFYDKNLSRNNTTSCASCHQQALGFTDSKTLSDGFDGGQTGAHSMRLANVRFYDGDDMFWDRRANTLEEQSTQPIQDATEMGFDDLHGGFDALISKLNDVEYYPSLFERAFGDEAINEDRVQRALAQFMRTIVSVDSRFDVGFETVYNPNGGGGPGGNDGVTDDFPNFTSQENLGKALFFGRAQCDQCHNSPTFSLRGNSNSNGLDAGETIKFKSPSLKNVGVTGPYMHDGRFTTLTQVVEHYNSGIQEGPALDNDLQNNNGPERLNLSEAEKEALVAFLHTLTDETNLSDPNLSDPFIIQN